MLKKALRFLSRPGPVRDLSSLPILVMGVFMMLVLGTRTPPTMLEDKMLAGAGGDYREVIFGVHGASGVYPLRIKYFDSPRYNGPPVIFVHGTGTSDAYFWRMRGEVDVFSGFIYAERRDVDAIGHAQGLADLGFDVVTYTYPDSRNRPIEYQAYDLARIITWTKEKFVRREVILVGHSMGGLVCRYYVESGQPGRKNYQFPFKERRDYTWNRYYNISDFEIQRMKYRYDVAKMVLVSTPNLGTLKKDGNDYGSPALFELKEESDFIQWLEAGRANAAAKGYKLPETHVFVGTAFENYMGEGPLDFGDGIVAVASAQGDFGGDPRVKDHIYRYPLDHFQMMMDGEVLAKFYNILNGPAL